jgi:hypothetical protein
MEPSLVSLIVQLEGAKRELRKFFEKSNREAAEEQNGQAGNVERIGSRIKEPLPEPKYVARPAPREHQAAPIIFPQRLCSR